MISARASSCLALLKGLSMVYADRRPADVTKEQYDSLIAEATRQILLLDENHDQQALAVWHEALKARWVVFEGEAAAVKMGLTTYAHEDTRDYLGGDRYEHR